MNYGTKLEILMASDVRRSGISDQKGSEYAGQAGGYKCDEADVLANFKRQAARWDTSPIKVMGVYLGKHIDSIETFVREVTKPGLTWQQRVAIAEKGEGIVSRLDDARNYLDLFECLLFEEKIHPEYLTPAGLRSAVEKGILTEEEAEDALLPPDPVRAIEIDEPEQTCRFYDTPCTCMDGEVCRRRNA